MGKFTLFDKVVELKDKFKSWFQHRNKLKALENYAEVCPFQHKGYLELIHKCMDSGFLGEKESDFLGHMLDRYEVNYLDWCQRTRWLKAHMTTIAEEQKAKVQAAAPKAQQFDLFRDHAPTQRLIKELPLGLVAHQGGAAHKWK